MSLFRLMPRSIDYFFYLLNNKLKEIQNESEEQSQYVVKVTFVEIYNEIIYEFTVDIYRQALDQTTHICGVSHKIPMQIIPIFLIQLHRPNSHYTL